jgi:hypothetical protein
VDASAAVKLAPTIRAETEMESMYRGVRFMAAMITYPAWRRNTALAFCDRPSDAT